MSVGGYISLNNSCMPIMILYKLDIPFSVISNCHWADWSTMHELIGQGILKL